jgi:hypothetical protein
MEPEALDGGVGFTWVFVLVLSLPLDVFRGWADQLLGLGEIVVDGVELGGCGFAQASELVGDEIEELMGAQCALRHKRRGAFHIGVN